MSGLLFAVLMAKALVPATADANVPRIMATGEMSVARAAHQATLLDSGQVLITGGRSSRCAEALRSVEIYDPATGRFQSTGDMAFPRQKHAAARLVAGPY